MCAEQQVFAFFKAKPIVDVGDFDFRQVGVEDLRHGRTCDVCAFLRKAAFCQIAAGVFGICQIDVGDDVHNAAVSFLW